MTMERRIKSRLNEIGMSEMELMYKANIQSEKIWRIKKVYKGFLDTEIDLMAQVMQIDPEFLLGIEGGQKVSFTKKISQLLQFRDRNLSELNSTMQIKKDENEWILLMAKDDKTIYTIDTLNKELIPRFNSRSRGFISKAIDYCGFRDVETNILSFQDIEERINSLKIPKYLNSKNGLGDTLTEDWLETAYSGETFFKDIV